MQSLLLTYAKRITILRRIHANKLLIGVDSRKQPKPSLRDQDQDQDRNIPVSSGH